MAEYRNHTNHLPDINWAQKYTKTRPDIKQKRTWINNEPTQPPRWASVDLRDGNQALPKPMNKNEKLRLYQLLQDIGFTEIEVGFPAASKIEQQFIKNLIKNHHDKNTNLQVLSQTRPEQLDIVANTLKGAEKITLHLYNSTSPAQRNWVFNTNENGVINIAALAGELAAKTAQKLYTSETTFQYSPESWTQTEPEIGLKAASAAIETWLENTDNPNIIINLPATVEIYNPIYYADAVQWTATQLRKKYGNITISIHPHNDRGTAVAAAELAHRAGADRIEGCLFGQGERTGNVDLITLALNMAVEGIDPKLNLKHIDKIAEIYQQCTHMPIPPRTPYAGKLVYTAYSGSHQDAIEKSLKQNTEMTWKIPYLPIDPRDVGRNYQAIIQVNSQSGRGGLRWTLQQKGYNLPKNLLKDYARRAQKHTEKTGTILDRDQAENLLLKYYQYTGKIKNLKIDYHNNQCHTTLTLHKKHVRTYKGTGIGILDAVANSMGVTIDEYFEHNIGTTSKATAICYIRSGNTWAIGTDEDTSRAAIKALAGIQQKQNKNSKN